MITKLTKSGKLKETLVKLYGWVRRDSIGKRYVHFSFFFNLLSFFLLRKYEVEMPTLKPFLFLTDGMGKTFFTFAAVAVFQSMQKHKRKKGSSLRSLKFVSSEKYTLACEWFEVD